MRNMKAVVKKVVNNCRLCIVRRARPVLPQMSSLPLCRVAIFMPPFSYTGLDYFGPYDVVIGRRHEKRWGALFTCLTTRAVYLDLVFSLSAKSCMAVLDGLVARRGLPIEIHTDNATSFVAAAKEYVGPSGHRPSWKFIPPRCPTIGGAWERLVAATKRALEGMSLPRTPTEEILRRLLANAERLVNSRPLTEIPIDPKEEDSLTPNHFLMGSSHGVKDPDLEPVADVKSSHHAWEEMMGHFWERWRNEYLPTIAARSKWHKPTASLVVGDLVFVCDDSYRSWIRNRPKSEPCPFGLRTGRFSNEPRPRWLH